VLLVTGEESADPERFAKHLLEFFHWSRRE
jgi:hypothetical protein